MKQGEQGAKENKIHKVEDGPLNTNGQLGRKQRLHFFALQVIIIPVGLCCPFKFLRGFLSSPYFTYLKMK